MIAAAFAVLLLDVILSLPDHVWIFDWPRFGLAVELPLMLAALWAMPISVRRRAVPVATALVVLVLILKIANSGIYVAFDRPFDAGVDLPLLVAGWDLLVRSHSYAFAIGAVGGGLLLVALIVVLIGASLGRLAFPPARPQRAAAAALAASVVVLLLPAPWGTRHSARLLADQAQVTVAGFRETAAFAEALAQDPVAGIADGRLLTALRGHDVLIVFVESYGRVAVEDPRYRDIAAQLDSIGAHLSAAGFGTRSAWVTSPTFGGESWFAHSTLLSGLWIENQRRYIALTKSTRPTLVKDFARAGWRTVIFQPEITMDWPEGRYYGSDTIYDAPTLKFAGAPLGYVTMPDQYTLAQLAARELVPTDRKPVMALTALVSSHAPWTPLPKLVPWDDVGDGRVFDTAREGENAEKIWADPAAVRRQYGKSIAYDLATLESFVLTYANGRTVTIVLGDHQPMSFISGEDGAREVPMHIIARDPAVLAKLDAWDLSHGMKPDSASPIVRMDSLRQRLAETFSARP